MDYDWEPKRTVVTTKEAKNSIKRLSETYSRFDQQWKGLKLFLEKTPEKGKAKKLESGRIIYVITRGSAYENTGLHEIMAVYTYNDNEVNVFDVAINNF